MTFTNLLNEIFNAAEEAANQTKSTTLSELENIDFSHITEEELNEVMDGLDAIKKNPICSLLIPSDTIDEIKAALQAKYDIAHAEEETEESEESTEIPEAVEKRLNSLVDEYLEKELGEDKDTPIAKMLTPAAREGYLKFGRFIYQHD